MKYLARIGVVAVACLAMANVALALDPREPFVEVTVPDGGIDLGSAYGPGWRQLAGQIEAKIVANRPYQVQASFEGFSHVRRKAVIAAGHLRVQINGQQVPVGVGCLVATSHVPRINTADVPIDLEVGVTGLTVYPPGQYTGVLVITVMALP